MSDADVVVVGSGAAALTAALTAASRGASVTVLERSHLFGGTSAVSGGGMWLPGNHLDPDFEDSLADARTYLEKLTFGLTPSSVIDRYLAEAGSIPEFFVEHSPLTFTADIGRPDYHAPWPGSSLTSRTVFPGPYPMTQLGEWDARVRRPGSGGILPIQHSEEREWGLAAGSQAGKILDGGPAPEGLKVDRDLINKILRERLEKGVALRGLALVGGLLEGCLAAGVRLVSRTRARSLVIDGGRVVGVSAENGADVTYRAAAGVILASGGFEWNRELWDAFVGVPWDGPATPPVNEGDGLVMAAAAGAKLANLDKVTWSPGLYFGETYDGHQYVRSSNVGQWPGEIVVNRTGRRFQNETLNYNDIGRVLTYFDPNTYEFPNHPAYVIGDRQALDHVQELARNAEPGKGDGWVTGATLREVAAGLGIDPDGLEDQVRAFNEHAVDGRDPVFHRGEKPWETHFLPNHETIGPIVDGPFVGFRLRASLFGTRGGPVINERAQIVRFDHEPIPGLYGAGNVVAHPFGSAYPGGGGTLGPAVTFGHIAGRSILEDGGAS